MRLRKQDKMKNSRITYYCDAKKRIKKTSYKNKRFKYQGKISEVEWNEKRSGEKRSSVEGNRE